MSVTVPSTEPAQVYVGDTVQWIRQDLSATYPATSWDLKYYLNSRSPAAQITIAAVADGDDFSVVIVPATTGAWTVSDRAHGGSGYYYVARVEHQSDGRIFTIDDGYLNISLSLEAQAAGGVDFRSWAEVALANIEAVLQGRASSDQLTYTVTFANGGGQQLQKMDIAQLQSFYGWLKAEVAMLSTNGKSQTIRVQFARGY